LQHGRCKIQPMTKRTIKAAAGKSHITVAAARAAARAVYRDSRTGKYIVAERGVSRATMRERVASAKANGSRRDETPVGKATDANAVKSSAPKTR